MPHRKSSTPQAPSAPTFESLQLGAPVLQALHEQGWQRPTPIQAQSIPEIMAGHDLIGVAQTGTGKTGAFLMPIIDKLGAPQGRVRALILEPTRELALQVGSHLEKINTHTKLKHAVIYG